MPDILTIHQGRWSDMSGRPLADVLADSYDQDAAFLRATPSCARFHRLSWHIEHYPAHETRQPPASPPLGYERYPINEDGTLGPRETHWESGD